MQVSHSMHARNAHDAPRSRIAGQIVAASDAQNELPHVGPSCASSHEPVLRVGSPCTKQYVSHVSLPCLCCVSTCFNQGSLSKRYARCSSKSRWKASPSRTQKCCSILRSTFSCVANGLLKIATAFAVAMSCLINVHKHGWCDTLCASSSPSLPMSEDPLR